LALGLAMRALLGATLIALLVLDLATTHHYATAIVLFLLFGFVVFEATQRYAGATAALPAPRTDRSTARQLDRTQALLDAVSVALVTMKADGRITLVNRAARRLAGADVARLADIGALGPQVAEAIAALPVGARQLVTTASGKPMLVWVAAFAAPEDGAQKLISLQAVTGELDTVQLKAWMDMSRVLSHEIMNSLTPIASLSESLGRMLPQQQAATPDAAEALAAISRRSHDLMSFVERYRRIADLPSPAVTLLDAVSFLADIDALSGAALRARGITWRSLPPPERLTFHADAALLSQALINLVHNAADAVTGRTAPQVTLTCRPEETGIVFSVSDNGLGIPQERLDDIFLPFFTTKSGGSGIGLTLARQIVLAHGGQISADTMPGGGMMFNVRLPLQT
jgi:nitrogen fixation/metabolism regulation signal transduction histidine kinase